MGQSCAVEAISFNGNGNVEAESFLGRMRGGAGSVLVQASDGCSYVIKSVENQQGPRVPFNEALGSLLASQIGLPVPAWAPITVSTSFVERNWASWTHGTSVLPQPGLYYGSMYLGSCSKISAYQVIPSSWIKQISNRSDFIGALVLDIWAENVDRRQALFIRHQGSHDLHVVFIDGGHFFRGPDGNHAPYVEWASIYYLTEVYAGLVNDQNMRKWIRWVDALGIDRIESCIDEVPDDWKIGIDTAEVVERLIRNREELREKVKWASRMLTRKLSVGQQVRGNHGSDGAVQLHNPREQCRC